MKCMFRVFAVFLAVICLVKTNSYACSRLTYVTKDGKVVIGRTMDWGTSDNACLKVVKREIVHKSASKTNPIEWKSKYGIMGVFSSLTGKHHFIASAINEKGLEADMLWLSESNYGKVLQDEKTIGISELLEYLLGNFATVDEVVDFVKNSKIRLEFTDNEQIFGDELVKFVESCKVNVQLTEAQKNEGFKLTLHYIVTDKTGNNAIIEYTDGRLQVYQQKGKIVLTNDPSYDKMLAIKDYFEEIGIKGSMPGSSLSQARFVYLTGWLGDIYDNNSSDGQMVLTVLSLMRGVSTPLNINFSLAQPNNASTLWRTVIDLTNNKFYFDSALSLAPIWIDINKVNFKKNQIFDLEKNKKIYGDITKKLKAVNSKAKKVKKTKKIKH